MHTRLPERKRSPRVTVQIATPTKAKLRLLAAYLECTQGAALAIALDDALMARDLKLSNSAIADKN